MVENSNPLNKYFRQPALYVSLPSGTNYPPHVVAQSQTGELGVMPMTAKDEIRFKTPDALMNGQGVVDVIQSCVPQIKDAWQIKSYDLDTLLIAIRIATYGETMDFTFTVPGANEQVTHSQNLPSLLDAIKGTEIQDEFVLEDGLKFSVRPLTYKDMTTASQQTFAQQKMYASVQDSFVKLNTSLVTDLCSCFGFSVFIFGYSVVCAVIFLASYLFVFPPFSPAGGLCMCRPHPGRGSLERHVPRRGRFGSIGAGACRRAPERRRCCPLVGHRGPPAAASGQHHL